MKKSSTRKSSRSSGKLFFPFSPGRINWWLFSAAIFFCYLGALPLAGDYPNWFRGLPLEVIAGILAWFAFPSRFQTPSEPKKAAKPRSRRLPSAQPLWLLAPLLLPAAMGQYCFFSDQWQQGLIYWALALLVAGFLKWKADENQTAESARLEIFGLVLVLAAASLMRIPFVGQHVVGLQIDEANNIQDAYSVLDGTTIHTPYKFGWGGNQALPSYFFAFFFKLFGRGIVVARLFSVLVSLTGLYFFYRWCRMFFSIKSSLAATFLLSTSWWYLFYSFSPFHNMLVVFFEILSFYFLERCLRSGEKADFVLLGVLLSMGAMGYLPGRLIPIMVGLVVLAVFASDYQKFLKVYLKPFLLTAFFFLLLTGPFISNVFYDPHEFLGRGKELSLFNEIRRTGHFDLIFTRSFWTLLSFAYPSEHYDERFALHHNPELDPLAGGLLFMGLFLALAEPKKRWSWVALIGFALGCVANAFAIQGPDPEPIYVNCMRFFLVIPFLFFLGARTLDWLSGLFMAKGPIPRILLTCFLLAAMAFSAFWNSRVFYVQFHQSSSGWAYLGFNHIGVANAMKTNYPRCHILLDSEFDSSTVQVLTLNQVKYTPLGTLPLPIPYKVDRDVMVIFQGRDFDEDKIRQTYPNAVWGDVKDDWGGIVVKTVEISKADIEALQKGRPTAGPLP